MSIDPIGGGFLAEKWDLIREIGRNMATSPVAPETPTGKPPSSLTPPDPVSQDIPPADDRSSPPINSPERARAAALSLMMEALRPPLAGPGERAKQEWTVALAQPLADLVKAGADGVKPMPGASAFEAGRAASSLGGSIVDPKFSEAGVALTSKTSAGASAEHLGAKQPLLTSPADVSLGFRSGSQLSQAGMERAFKIEAHRAGAQQEFLTGTSEPNQHEAGTERTSVVQARSEASRIGALLEPLADRAGAPPAMRHLGAGEKLALSNFVPLMILPTEAASVQTEMIRRGLAELDLTSMAIGVMPAAPERAGVIASFVLNAHFLPGWPPMRPVESPEAKAFVKRLALDKTLTKSDIEMLTYLANFGLSRQHLEKLIKTLKRAGKRSGLLQALACFVSNLSAALRAMGTELETFIADLTVEEQMQAKTAAGNRRRIDLG